MMPKTRLKGKVKSNKMDKTVIVEVESWSPHPKYKKIMKRVKKFYAHSDEKIEPGTKVEIEETKPISKLKRWVVVEIIDGKSEK